MENAYTRLHEWIAGGRKGTFTRCGCGRSRRWDRRSSSRSWWLFAIGLPEHVTFDELGDEMDAALRFPGIPNIWTMPIRNRIDMLSTGVRTPIGIKILGPDLKVIQRIGEDVERIVRDVTGTRTVLAERTAGGYYLDFVLRRDALARLLVYPVLYAIWKWRFVMRRGSIALQPERAAWAVGGDC